MAVTPDWQDVANSELTRQRGDGNPGVHGAPNTRGYPTPEALSLVFTRRPL
jgi:hypothetical protein